MTSGVNIVPRVYDAASNVIETQAQGAISKNGEFSFCPEAAAAELIFEF